MAISQYMETKVITCPPETTISESAKLMKSNNVGTIVVQKMVNRKGS